MIWFGKSFIKFCKSFIDLMKLVSTLTCSSARVRVHNYIHTYFWKIIIRTYQWGWVSLYWIIGLWAIGSTAVNTLTAHFPNAGAVFLSGIDQSHSKHFQTANQKKKGKEINTPKKLFKQQLSAIASQLHDNEGIICDLQLHYTAALAVQWHWRHPTLPPMQAHAAAAPQQQPRQQFCLLNLDAWGVALFALARGSCLAA